MVLGALDREPFRKWVQALARELTAAADAEPTELRRLFVRIEAAAELEKSGDMASNEGGGESYQDSLTVLHENFREVMWSVDLATWSDLIAAYGESQLPIDGPTARHMKTISLAWRSLEEAQPHDLANASVQLVRLLAEVLDWRFIKSDTIENATVPYVAVQHTPLTLPPMIPVLTARTGAGESCVAPAVDALLDLKEMISESRGSPPSVLLVLVLGAPEDVLAFRGKLSDERGIVIVGEHNLKGVMLSSPYHVEVNKLLRDALGLRRYNPYRYLKPVESPSMFYGRGEEIHTILDSPTSDFAVVGSRRIGKTSLCQRLARISAENDDALPIYINCGVIRAPEELVDEIVAAMNPRRLGKVRLSTLGRFVRASYTAKEKRYLLLLDEIDGLLRMASESRDWSMFETLRDLAQQQVTQTVLTGYRTLYQEWMDLKSPLYNFVTPLYLSTLDKASARQLATKPMKALNIGYESEEIPQRILTETGCHPCFLQFFCSTLLLSLEGQDREVTWQHYRDAHEGKEFRDFLLQPFSMPDALTPLEKLILVELATAVAVDFDVGVVLSLLETANLGMSTEDVVRALASLEVAGLLTRDEPSRTRKGGTQTYRFTLPAFPTALSRAYPLDREKPELIEQVRKGGGSA